MITKSSIYQSSFISSPVADVLHFCGVKPRPLHWSNILFQLRLHWRKEKKDSQPFYSNITLPKTNIAPENRPFQKESSIPTIHFQVLC